jgi:outer membrane protein OmpA-like peptidoglycan-associated protein
VVFLVVAITAGAAGSAVWFTRNEAAAPAATTVTTAPATTAPATTAPATTAPATTAPVTTVGTTITTLTAPVTTTAPPRQPVTATPADPAQPVATREFRFDGTLSFTGAIGDQAAAEAVMVTLAGALGSARVSARLIVDERARATEVPVRAPTVATYVGGTTTFSEGFLQLLDVVSQVLRAIPGSSLTLTGFGDDQGVLEDNLAASRRRAEAVASLLVGRGVERNRIRIVGKGPAEPIASNATEAGRFRNRRVEVSLAGVL